MTALLDLGAGVEWTDGEAAAAARRAARPEHGRLADLVEWLAGTQGGYPPHPPVRPRLVVLGGVAPAILELAASLDVGVRELHPDAAGAAGCAAGSAAVDAEVEGGADLLVLAGADAPGVAPDAPAVAVSLLTGAEPVALLPRGAAAVDTAGWIASATAIRDGRRAVEDLRLRPDELLAALGSPAFAAAAGFALQAATRRTPVVLDGPLTAAAALLCYETQSRAARWWQLADTSADQVHTRAAERLGRHPLLDLGAGCGDGTSGLLAVQLLRAAAVLG